MVHRHCGRPAFAARTRRGLTLVEMMVSVALTLMVVFALVRVFALLGETVTDSRATMELSASLRQAANLLRDDLAGSTVTTLPGRDPEQSDGYFEVIDGPSTDSQHYVRLASGDLSPAPIHISSATDSDGDKFLDTIDVPYDTSVGDIDDILAFTSRNATHPFQGTISHPRIAILVQNPNDEKSFLPQVLVSPQAPTRIIDSPEAEIIWWLQAERNRPVDDLTSLGNLSDAEQIANSTTAEGGIQRYPNATTQTLGTPVRSLHRRVLLVRPDLNLSFIKLPTLIDVASFISNNDLSVSVYWSSSENTYKVKANSLGDLALRHNRACRLSYDRKDPVLKQRQLSRTILFAQHDGELMGPASLLLQHAAMKDMVLNSIQPEPVPMLRRGKDVILSDALGFDIQVWDPKAVVGLAVDGTALSPSDPGYSGQLIPASLGAYVDLGFATKTSQTIPAGQFGGPIHTKSALNNLGSDISGTWPNYNLWVPYCTWCAEYEHDGLEQHTSREIRARYNTLNIPGPIIDEGENGFDDDNLNGVDDPGERETSPPYPYPLRGVKVSLRVMDFNTRQVRQTSVVTDFLPE